MFIMGTAGHIDHGKTTLITALTGINPDRLQEEQSRGMTVDLGFAWFALPQGNVGVVDVPGHHRLIKNMLAGVGMVDFVLLVVAADDGWMPQTQEHVDILHLYGIKRGVVALTKADLVDPEWLELVKADLHEHLAGTSLADFPIIPVSSTTGFNIEVLKNTLNEIITALPRDLEGDNPLLWIDRVFTIKGAGTVVTGTLMGGYLNVGMDVVVEPLGSRARIRGLQTQTKTVEKGVPHSRLAVNLTGVEKEELTRGMYLALPNRRPYYSLINSFVQILPQAPASLESGQHIKLYVGTLETLAKVKVLGAEEIRPDQEGYVQLELEQPAHFSFRDRFILRHSELQDTLGGGFFLEAAIPVRGTNLRLVGSQRRQQLFPFEKGISYLNLDRLEKKRQANPESLSLLVAAERPFWTRAQFAELGLGLHPKIVQFGDYLMAPSQLDKLQAYLRNVVNKHHEDHPLAPGPSKETLRTATGVPPRLFDQVLASTPSLREDKGAVSSVDHRISLTPEEETTLQALLQTVARTPYEPPNLAQLVEEGYPKQLIFAASHLGILVSLPNEHWTTPEILQSIQGVLYQEGAFRSEFELATFRDRFGTSRKYALAFLDYFDAQGITIRKGDVRVLSKRPLED